MAEYSSDGAAHVARLRRQLISENLAFIRQQWPDEEFEQAEPQQPVAAPQQRQPSQAGNQGGRQGLRADGVSNNVRSAASPQEVEVPQAANRRSRSQSRATNAVGDDSNSSDRDESSNPRDKHPRLK